MIKVSILAALVAKGDVARAVAEAIRQALHHGERHPIEDHQPVGEDR